MKVPEPLSRHFLLYRDGRTARAVEAPYRVIHDYPDVLSFSGRPYRRLLGDATFIFWDDLRDPSGLTVGFTFFSPDDERLLASSLISDSDNVRVESTGDRSEVSIFLSECDDCRVECVQGFGSEIYQCLSDPLDCLLLMYDYSENAIGFELAKDIDIEVVE